MAETEPQRRAALLEGYLQQDPGNLTLCAELVDLLMDSGRLADARVHAQAALRQAPDDKPFTYRMAVIERHSGHLPAARELLMALVNQGVDAPAVRFELASVQAALADFQACVQTLDALSKQALPEALAEQATFLHLRALHYLGELDSAIERAEQFLQIKPNSPTIVPALATLYLDAQRLGDAKRLFDEAEKNHALNAEMLTVGGFIALDGAELVAAQQHFERSVAQAADSGRAFLGLGLVHAAAGRLAPAKAALVEATHKMPAHLGSWHALAWMQLLDKEIDAAEHAFNQALAIDRNFGDTYGGLAIVAALRGNRSLAEEHIRTGRRLDRASLNVGVAITLLQHGGAMDTQEFLDSALKMLHKHALSNNAAMRASFERLMAQHMPGRE